MGGRHIVGKAWSVGGRDITGRCGQWAGEMGKVAQAAAG